MRIPLGHVVRLMPEQPWDFIQVDPALHGPRGECRAQVMEPKIRNMPGASSDYRLRGVPTFTTPGRINFPPASAVSERTL